MNSILDNKDKLKSYDKEDMLNDLAKYPEDAKQAMTLAKKMPLAEISGINYDYILFIGMGGSAIGGKLISDWLRGILNIPIFINRGYNLPKYITKKTLVFAVSYSGDTEETLKALDEACKIGCRIIIITSNGQLESLALERGISFIKMPGGRQPRSALAYQFFIPVTILWRLKLISEVWNEVDEAIQVLGQLRDRYHILNPTNSNPAKQLTLKIMDSIPFIYGSQLFDGVTYRVSTQFNENSKTPASHGVFPEIFHNAIMGTEGSKHVLQKICFIIVRDPLGEDSLTDKINRFIDVIEPRVNSLIQIEAIGKGRLSRMFSIIYLGDFSSVYLGILRGHDPNTTKSIDQLKQKP